MISKHMLDFWDNFVKMKNPKRNYESVASPWKLSYIGMRPPFP